MKSACEQLEPFIDGELSTSRAEAFRDHLAGCDDCQRELHGLMQLEMLASSLPAESLVVSPGPTRRRGWRWLVSATALGAAVLALVLWSSWRAPVGPEPLLALNTTARTIEARLAHPALAGWRPLQTLRAGVSHPQPVPLSLLAELERRGAPRAIGEAYLARGEVGQAEAFLARAPADADTESDRAAAELQGHKPAEALRHADAALALRSDHPAALWNRALALRDLGLPAAAAEAFSGLASNGEPGWSEEARRRAAGLDESVRRARAGWGRVRALGEAMVSGKAPLPEALVRAHPGLSRVFFYDAVRTAPSPERLRALEPLARVLDSLAGRDELQDLLRRTSSGPFPSEALQAYRAKVLPSASSKPSSQRLLTLARASGRDDLLLGAMLLTGEAATAVDAYTRIAEGTGDPWYRLLASQQRGRAALRRGRPVDAERALRTALSRCPVRGVEYRCAGLALQLAGLLVEEHRVDQALSWLSRATPWIAAAGDWGLGLQLIELRAESARLSDAFSVALAFLRERELREPDRCDVQRFTRVSAASIEFQQGQPERARREAEAVPDCGEKPSVQLLLLLADLQRFHGTPAEQRRLDTGLAELRKDAGAGALAMADVIEARRELSADPGRARAAALAAVRRAEGAPPEDGDAQRARGFAFTTLATLAGVGGEPHEVIRLVADELKLPTPSSCAAGVSLDDERLVFAVLDSQGVASGEVSAVELPLRSPVAFPAPLAARLDGCETVRVFARPPLQGDSTLLPSRLAWSFAAAPSAVIPTGKGPRVIVAEALPPPELGLAALGPFTGDSRGAVVLRGAEATPERVLRALETASEIELHVHGYLDGVVPGAAHLALSPSTDGRFALSAEDVARLELTGAPVVLLAACEAAQSARYLHRSWSLPAAFLKAGARAVFAPSGTLPDDGATAFFEAVLKRIRGGERPARALRDERTAWLERKQGWVTSVVLFEH